MLHRLRLKGFTACVIEAGSGVGGTWYWNRYPGARCDVESVQYSYQFSDDLFQDWQWSERFATQPELQAYARHVAERFDLLRDIRFNCAVKAAAFDEGNACWQVDDETGGRHRVRFLILAAGCLSSTHLPDIDGLDSFGGPLLHTGRWPQEGADLRGRVVGIIGTGSSAVQVLPTIAPDVRQLIVFQRTANYVVPAHNGPIAAAYESEVKQNHADFRRHNASMVRGHGWRHRGQDIPALSVTREEVESDLQQRWETGGLNLLDGYTDLLTDLRANGIAADFVRHQIRRIVKDPDVAEQLCPHHPIGCKRVSVGDGYYETFNRDNVRLVDIRRTPIERVTPQGVVVDGQTHAMDVLICATGFDAMTGPILAIDLVGTGGQRLQDRWRAGPRNYLGLSVHGFPNLFLLTGPGSPSVLSNMHVSIEQHTAWVTDCLAAMQQAGQTRIEARQEAEADWVSRVDQIAGGTIFPSCNSWYLGANIPGKPRLFMPFIGVPAYARLSERVAEDDYAGFDRS